MAKKDTAPAANTKKEEKVVIDIVRGRMPVPMVFLIRFAFQGTDGELAAMFRTTPGKVNDIKKGRNFGYITEDTKFTKEQIDAARERATKLSDEDKAKVLAELDKMTPATEAEAAQLEESRKAARKPRGGAKVEPTGEDGEAGESSETGESKDSDAEAEDLDALLS